jgi:cytidyltransferase-like protein
VTLPSIAGDVQLTGAEVIKTTYYVAYTAAIFECLVLPKELSWSRFGTLTSLLLRLGPALLHGLGLPNYEQSIADVMCDGFFMSVLTTDITLAKMAGREIHPWVVLMGFASSFSYSVTFTLTAVYYIAVFGDLCHYMNLPLLTVCRNVYCDGVYDLCHIGHKNLFKRALTYGNRLFVGVVGDADASNYKRPPIMSHDERCAEVAGCKHVTKVIQNSPCFGLTQEFIDLHQIHVVAFGQEYLERWPDPKDDIYYGYARQIGIAKPMPRTQGLSTSDLIRRIQAARPADEKKSPT